LVWQDTTAHGSGNCHIPVVQYLYDLGADKEEPAHGMMG